MLGAFDALAIDSYEVTFHLRRLRAHLMPASVAQIRNRRFRKLIQLQREGIYFADQFMADRDPILFHRYVVAHMPPAERHVWELTRSAERYIMQPRVSTANDADLTGALIRIDLLLLHLARFFIWNRLLCSKGKISSAILKVHDRQCAREQFDSMVRVAAFCRQHITHRLYFIFIRCNSLFQLSCQSNV